MSILNNPEAQVLLGDATVTAAQVCACQGQLELFLERYLPLFDRVEQAENARRVIQGLLSGLDRKTCEPIARQSGVQRKPIQSFVGRSSWDDEALMAELRQHVREELGDDQAVFVVDTSGFAKKGQASCGVQPQWCGRLGKIENCQIGVFLAYATHTSHAPLDRRLYLPEEWAHDGQRRRQGRVPPMVRYRETWRIAMEMIRRSRDLPHGWVTADDEFGRASEFRAHLRQDRERYLLDVPSNTLVREQDRPRPPRRQAGRGRKRVVPYCRVDEWAARQPGSRWQTIVLGAGEKGPLKVEAMSASMQSKLQGKNGPRERLVVIRRLDKERKIIYCLSNAAPEVPLAQLVEVRSRRQQVEQVFQEGKGEVGLAQYEVRSWVGWHHHMTLALLALWFLILQRRRAAEKKDGRVGAADPTDLHRPAATPTAHAS